MSAVHYAYLNTHENIWICWNKTRKSNFFRDWRSPLWILHVFRCFRSKVFSRFQQCAFMTNSNPCSLQYVFFLTFFWLVVWSSISCSYAPVSYGHLAKNYIEKWIAFWHWVYGAVNMPMKQIVFEKFFSFVSNSRIYILCTMVVKKWLCTIHKSRRSGKSS